jgi:hypothetical protein
MANEEIFIRLLVRTEIWKIDDEDEMLAALGRKTCRFANDHFVEHEHEIG